jgi:hypothetical protein
LPRFPLFQPLADVLGDAEWIQGDDGTAKSLVVWVSSPALGSPPDARALEAAP